MTSRERRAIVMGAGVVLAGFAVIWGRMYRDALASARDELATERATLARERVAVATARHNPQLQHIADSAMRAMRPRLFEGKDDVMASSELASYVGDVARRARVWLQDAGTRPASPAAEGVRTLRVEIRAESDLQGALLFLHISHAARSDEKDAEVLSIAATISGFAVSDSMTTASLAHPTVASVSSIVEVPR